MSAVISVMSYISLPLLFCNVLWDQWGRLYRRAVPGSLAQEHCARRRRLFRWPGFFFIPMGMPGWLTLTADSADHWYFFLWLLFMPFITLGFLGDYYRLRRELDEDDDDWMKRGKKKTKKVWRAVKKSFTIKVPQVALAPIPMRRDA